MLHQKQLYLDIFRWIILASGDKRPGMAVCSNQGFTRSIHNIENTPSVRRSLTAGDLDEQGNIGESVISDAN